MDTIREFDLLESPLEGINLIEASAGTGKTYNLTGLYIRLLLEKGLNIENILVVTFTKSATEELKQRIREKLLEAINAIISGDSKDSTISRIIQKVPNPSKALISVKSYIREFEKAQIYTIHSFCNNILQDFSFESNAIFESDFIEDEMELLLEAVEDFWRKNLLNESTLFSYYLLLNKIHPEKILDINNFSAVIQSHFLKIKHPNTIPDTSRLEKEFLDSFYNLKEIWKKYKDEIRQLLLSYEGLNRNKYSKKNIIDQMQKIDFLINIGPNAIFYDKDIESLTQESIIKGTRKNFDPPAHTFFEECSKFISIKSSLEELFEKKKIAILNSLFEYVKKELKNKKQKINIRTYNDLLILVYEALKSPRGHILKNALRERYHSALIDEFQDTEPIQYEIFKEIFASNGGNLFLIGDPKQSIYGFRGADVFTYINATKKIDNKYTLNTNWRSRPGLISAINAIFSKHQKPFVFPEISLSPSRPADSSQNNDILIEGKKPSPLCIWFINASKNHNKFINKGSATEIIFHAIASEIVRILKLSRMEKATINGRPISASDFAIIVTSNRQIKALKEIFEQYQIPCVLSSTISVFETHEAKELLRILKAVVNPKNKQLIRSALITDMIGFKAEDIEELNSNPDMWDIWATTFKELNILWSNIGFMRMLSSLIKKENILINLARFKDGERRLTNIKHLIELIIEIEANKHLSMTETIKWLSEKINNPNPALEEHQLRLETDEDAVNILTVHKSKGLEYPIVFAPVGWEHKRPKNKDEFILFHNTKDEMKLSLDFTLDKKSEPYLMSEKEKLSENLRLLYVAMTRAKHMCYIVWGKIREAEKSALAHLLHSRDENGVVPSYFKDLTDDEILNDLIQLKNRCPEGIDIKEIPDKEEEISLKDEKYPVSLSLRSFKGKVDGSWCVSSYSSLIYRIPEGEDVGDYDQIDIAYPKSSYPEEYEKKFQSFPMGPRAGVCIHQIMENLDFQEADEDKIRLLIKEKLSEHGFEILWEDALLNMINNLISTNLLKNKPELKLSSISKKMRLNELEFYFPIKLLSPDILKELFKENFRLNVPGEFPEQIGRLTFSPFRGFMKGFIDLVFLFENQFFIIDWKTNYLGPEPSDYSQEIIREEMLRHYYFLQAIIYTLAANQYLRQRLPDYNYQQNFGGTLYLFVRGISPDLGPDYGIYCLKPDGRAIEEVSKILIGN